MDIAALAEEIHENNVRLGWVGRDGVNAPFPDRLMLLASEVSEAFEAFRKHGFEDMTLKFTISSDGISKPEGVGSELADCAIRYLDLCRELGFPFPESLRAEGEPEPRQTFPVACMTLTACVGLAFEEWTHNGLAGATTPLLLFWEGLLRVACAWGIDLEAETRRKVDYNATRVWRHGGKRL